MGGKIDAYIDVGELYPATIEWLEIDALKCPHIHGLHSSILETTGNS